MGAKDITVNIADGVFNYRVGAIIVDSGEILMVKNSGASFYYTVGGRIQFGESAGEAVLRETFEETQIQLEIDRLAYIHENFFVMDSDGEVYHEVCLFFLMKPNSKIREMKNSSFKEEYGDVAYHWLPIHNLTDFHIYPEFFKTELIKPANETQYCITKEGNTAVMGNKALDCMQSVVSIETDRLIVRDYKKSDLAEMHRLWSDKETMYYLDDILTNTIEESARYLKIGIDNADGHYFCICEKGADSFIGSIGYTITESTPLGKIVHMGYMMLPEYHGRGYMTEAAKAVIEFAFTKDDCIRITTGCITAHEASRRVMEKVGFRKEGLRIRAQYHDGEMKDRFEYAINKDDFMAEICRKERF